jgi:hypothetical protein
MLSVTTIILFFMPWRLFDAGAAVLQVGASYSDRLSPA